MFQSVAVKDDVIEIEIGNWGSSAYDFPGDEQMALANQQVVYTVQAATKRDLPIRYVADGAAR